MRNITVYIGLFRSDGTEPLPKAGYTRACLGEMDILDVPQAPQGRDIVFDDVTAPGWGHITEYRAYDCPEGGEALYIWPLSAPVHAHPETIPVIHDGRLLLGVDVSANIILQSVHVVHVADATNT